MSFLAATYAAIKQQFWTLDTGAGGLNGTGTAKVAEWFRIDHANYTADRTGRRPSVLMEVIEQPDDAFGVYGVNAIARLHIVTQRDLGFESNVGNTQPSLDAIIARIETLAKAAGGMVLADAAAEWIYTPMQYQRAYRAGVTTSQLHYVSELLFTASNP